MAKVIFGNHSAVVVPRTEKDRFREFYRDVLGCEIIRESDRKDDFRMGGGVQEMRQKIVASGVKVLEMHDSHLYFQAPGGQVWRLVGVNEDLSRYEGTDHRELPSYFD